MEFQILVIIHHSKTGEVITATIAKYNSMEMAEQVCKRMRDKAFISIVRLY